MNSNYNKTNKQGKNKKVKEEFKTTKNVGKKTTIKDEEWRRKERR